MEMVWLVRGWGGNRMVKKKVKKVSPKEGLKFNDLFPMISYEAFKKIENKKPFKFDGESFLKSQKIIPEVANIRGKIINHAISIERVMDFIIASYFSESMKDLLKFKNLILSKSQVTIFLKWNIFREITKDYIYFNKIKDISELKRDMLEVIETRNNFAHGELKFDTLSMEPYLEYYKDGIKKKKITQSYLDGLNKKLGRVHENLVKVYMRIMTEKYIPKNKGTEKVLRKAGDELEADAKKGEVRLRKGKKNSINHNIFIHI